MIPLHRTIERVVNLNVTFVRSDARCDCYSIVSLRFQVVQIQQVDRKMSTKNVNNYKSKTFRDIFGQLHTQEYKGRKKQIVRLQLNEKKSKESQKRLKILKTKAYLKEGPDNI